MRAVKVNRTLYPKSGYLSDSYQFAPKSALFRLRTRQKSQAAHSSRLQLTKNVKIFDQKNYSRIYAKFEKGAALSSRLPCFETHFPTAQNDRSRNRA